MHRWEKALRDDYNAPNDSQSLNLDFDYLAQPAVGPHSCCASALRQEWVKTCLVVSGEVLKGFESGLNDFGLP